jgi:hypothetical protein
VTATRKPASSSRSTLPSRRVIRTTAGSSVLS